MPVFSGGWSQLDADNAETIMSRTGYVITYAGCPVLVCIMLQTKTALCITEVE